MNNIEYIKNKIELFYKKSPDINIIINTSRSKSTDMIPVKIYGIYPNIFCVEETETQCPKKYSFQYVDVLIGRVIIKELPISTETNTKKKR